MKGLSLPVIKKQIAIVKNEKDEGKIKQAIVELMRFNSPTFWQWKKVLKSLFRKRVSDRHFIYQVYVMACRKIKENKIPFKVEREFSDWFWKRYKKLYNLK